LSLPFKKLHLSGEPNDGFEEPDGDNRLFKQGRDADTRALHLNLPPLIAADGDNESAYSFALAVALVFSD
jgi:hypothetical protein